MGCPRRGRLPTVSKAGRKRWKLVVLPSRKPAILRGALPYALFL